MSETINGVAVIEKSIRILESLVGFPDGKSLGDISKSTGISKSTVHRILCTFRQFNYVTQDMQTGYYSIGGRMMIYMPYIASFDKYTRIRPFMKSFTDETGLSTNLAILDGHQTVTIDTCSPVTNASIKVVAECGYHSDLYCCATGKAFLSGFTKEEFDRYTADAQMYKKTVSTIIDPHLLECDIRDSTSRGFFVENLENEDHIISIASPVYDAQDKICASIGAMMLSINASSKDLFKLGTLLHKKAMLASQALGSSYKENFK